MLRCFEPQHADDLEMIGKFMAATACSDMKNDMTAFKRKMEMSSVRGVWPKRRRTTARAASEPRLHEARGQDEDAEDEEDGLVAEERVGLLAGMAPLSGSRMIASRLVIMSGSALDTQRTRQTAEDGERVQARDGEALRAAAASSTNQ